MLDMGLSHSHRAPLPFKERVLREYVSGAPSYRFLSEVVRLYLEAIKARGPLLTEESFVHVFSSVLRVGDGLSSASPRVGEPGSPTAPAPLLPRRQTQRPTSTPSGTDPALEGWWTHGRPSALSWPSQLSRLWT